MHADMLLWHLYCKDQPWKFANRSGSPPAGKELFGHTSFMLHQPMPSVLDWSWYSFEGNLYLQWYKACSSWMLMGFGIDSLADQEWLELIQLRATHQHAKMIKETGQGAAQSIKISKRAYWNAKHVQKFVEASGPSLHFPAKARVSSKSHARAIYSIRPCMPTKLSCIVWEELWPTLPRTRMMFGKPQKDFQMYITRCT